MRTAYNLVFIIFFILSSPYYFLKMWRRGNWRTGFRQRFGDYDAKVRQSITNRQILWMHAVSVGEMNVCVQVIRALEPRMPNLKIVVSTTTTTAMGELQKRLPAHVTKIYYPVDRRKYVASALATIHPHAFALIESEIWPNFLWQAKAKGIPLFLINARLSERSFPRYKRFSFLFRPLFGSFAAVGAQNEDDAARLRELGCAPDAVHVVGNLKFDAAKLEGKALLDVPALLAELGVPAGAPIVVAGSTHPGEDEILAEQLPRLRKQFPGLFLILVPRHFERSPAVADALTKRGIKFVLRSEVSPDNQHDAGSVECLLVNTTGELRYFYEVATVVFVGKSLVARGGQNPIEPAALGKAVVFGPNMQNFKDVVKIFLDGDAVVQVPDSAKLEKALAELLSRPERRAQLGQNALNVVRANQGAVKRTVDMIVEQLAGHDFYVAPSRQTADPAQN
jgi:3-deoxy-D-manno-octulosonic-acid transferase